MPTGISSGIGWSSPFARWLRSTCRCVITPGWLERPRPSDSRIDVDQLDGELPAVGALHDVADKHHPARERLLEARRVARGSFQAITSCIGMYSTREPTL